MNISGQSLHLICPFVKIDRAVFLAQLMNEVFPQYHIDTLNRVRMSISQMAHESQEFNVKSENLNYSAQSLANTWPKRFAIDPSAKIKQPNSLALNLQRQPVKIANIVYGGRLGNTEPNDGWVLRGSGFIQLTGKDAIGEYAKFKGLVDAYEAAVLLRNKDQYALDSACWFLTHYKNTLPLMDAEDFKGLTKAINGGYIGLEERIKYYDKAIAFIK